MQVTWIDFILRFIPEAFVYILAGYAISKTVVDVKKFLISTFLLAIIAFVVKIASQDFGIPQILIILACSILLITVNSISAVKAISASLLTMILTVILEIINFAILNKGFGLTQEVLDSSTNLAKFYYGLPSLLVLILIVENLYFILVKRNKGKDADIA